MTATGTAFAEMLNTISNWGLTARLTATHVDDGNGHCAAPACGSGRRPWPCSMVGLAAAAAAAKRVPPPRRAT